MKLPESLLSTQPPTVTRLIPLGPEDLESWLPDQPAPVRGWVAGTGFEARSGTNCLVPGPDGRVESVLVGLVEPLDTWWLGDLAATLPAGAYCLEADLPVALRERIAVGWALGAYRFERYREARSTVAQLVVDASCNLASVIRRVKAVYRVRDLINTPAQDLMPEQLAAVARSLAERYEAELRQVVGEALLGQNYPMIHAVGRASAHPPRLLDLRWGEVQHPALTVVGKGVCFDSGGLDLKTSGGMRLMKKDMGGAAHALGLAQLVMDAELPVSLRVLIPAVENAVAGNAYRPGDVLRSRHGLTVEIDNTDAEGRLVLSDALTEASGEAPDLLLDFATLTGAARVALGTELPAFFAEDDQIARGLAEAAGRTSDPIWRMPLHSAYRPQLDSMIADLTNASKSRFGGAITAALFLREFVADPTRWVHFDLMGWNERARPGRPEGGEAMALLATFEYLRTRYP